MLNGQSHHFLSETRKLIEKNTKGLLVLSALKSEKSILHGDWCNNVFNGLTSHVVVERETHQRMAIPFEKYHNSR